MLCSSVMVCYIYIYILLYIYITDCILHQVCVFRTNGDFIESFGSPETFGKLNSPRGIAIDRDGFVYVCDHRNSRIQVF